MSWKGWLAESGYSESGYGRLKEGPGEPGGGHGGARQRARRCWCWAAACRAAARLDELRHSAALQQLQTIATASSAGFYVAETYFPADAHLPKGIVAGDLLITSIFVLDLLLGLVWARRRLLPHVFSQRTALDLVAIAPGVVTIAGFDMHSVPFVHVFKVARVLRLLQQTSSLQADDALSDRPQYAKLLRGRVAWFVVSLFILLFVSASLVLTLERGYADGRLSWRTRPPPGADADGDGLDGGAFGGAAFFYHQAQYFVVVTFSTVGFGDIHAECPEAQVLMILLIVSAFLIVPYQARAPERSAQLFTS